MEKSTGAGWSSGIWIDDYNRLQWAKEREGAISLRLNGKRVAHNLPKGLSREQLRSCLRLMGMRVHLGGRQVVFRPLLLGGMQGSDRTHEAVESLDQIAAALKDHNLEQIDRALRKLVQRIKRIQQSGQKVNLPALSHRYIAQIQESETTLLPIRSRIQLANVLRLMVFGSYADMRQRAFVGADREKLIGTMNQHRKVVAHYSNQEEGRSANMGYNRAYYEFTLLEQAFKGLHYVSGWEEASGSHSLAIVKNLLLLASGDFLAAGELLQVGVGAVYTAICQRMGRNLIGKMILLEGYYQMVPTFEREPEKGEEIYQLVKREFLLKNWSWRGDWQLLYGALHLLTALALESRNEGLQRQLWEDLRRAADFDQFIGLRKETRTNNWRIRLKAMEGIYRLANQSTNPSLKQEATDFIDQRVYGQERYRRTVLPVIEQIPYVVDSIDHNRSSYDPSGDYLPPDCIGLEVEKTRRGQRREYFMQLMSSFVRATLDRSSASSEKLEEEQREEMREIKSDPLRRHQLMLREIALRLHPEERERSYQVALSGLADAPYLGVQSLHTGEATPLLARELAPCSLAQIDLPPRLARKLGVRTTADWLAQVEGSYLQEAPDSLIAESQAIGALIPIEVPYRSAPQLVESVLNGLSLNRSLVVAFVLSRCNTSVLTSPLEQAVDQLYEILSQRGTADELIDQVYRYLQVNPLFQGHLPRGEFVPVLERFGEYEQDDVEMWGMLAWSGEGKRYGASYDISCHGEPWELYTSIYNEASEWGRSWAVEGEHEEQIEQLIEQRVEEGALAKERRALHILLYRPTALLPIDRQSLSSDRSSSASPPRRERASAYQGKVKAGLIYRPIERKHHRKEFTYTIDRQSRFYYLKLLAYPVNISAKHSPHLSEARIGQLATEYQSILNRELQEIQTEKIPQ